MTSEAFDPEAVSDEVLSAYLDGELPAPQLAKIERWLAQTPAAQRRLLDFRRISNWVQELPRGELPSEFSSRVLQEAERQMLLPVAAARPFPWRRVRWWTLTVVSPVTAAAALLVISLQVFRPPAEDRAAVAMRDSGPAVAQTREAVGSSSDATSVAAREGRDETETTRDLAGESSGDKAPLLSRSSGIADPATDGDADGLPKDAAVAAKETAPADALAEAQAGSLLARIREANEQGQTPVVRLFVVDRREGMEVVQVVLDGQQIPRDRVALSPAEEFRESEKTDGAAAAKPGAPTEGAEPKKRVVYGRQALFVVADAEKLGASLKALRQKKGSVANWELAETIDLARQLDPRSQKRVQDALVALGAPSDRKTSAESNKGGAPVPASEPAPAVADRERPDPDERTERGFLNVRSPREKTARSPGALGQQLLVNVADAPVVSSSLAASAPAAPAAPTPQPTDVGRSAAPSGKKLTRNDRSSLVQVILLIEPQAAPPAALPPPDNPDGGGAA